MRRTLSQDDLVYDIGMHNGDDTAFYLRCGYRVVAVEADPALALAGTARFSEEVTSGKLTVLNVAIAEKEGEADFWINEEAPHFNSFDRESVARFGHAHHSVKVPCRRLDNILRERGIPCYLKIDIEGHDLVACRQLTSETRPESISVELSDAEQVHQLQELGYDRFKLVPQLNLHPIKAAPIQFYLPFLRSLFEIANDCQPHRRLVLRLRRRLASYLVRFGKSLGMHPWGEPALLQSKRVPEWEFAPGSSGTFGEDLPGEWMTAEQVLFYWKRDVREYEKFGREYWCDLHAIASSASG